MFNGLLQVNSVDVVGADGLVRYGRVIDLADNGFFVDFLCPTGRRRFFPFDSNVFLTTRSSHPYGMDIASVYAHPQLLIPVEVLMRESGSSRWKWFPAEMINLARGRNHESYDAVVVNWGNNLSGADIVPATRIRPRVPTTWWGRVENQQQQREFRSEYGVSMQSSSHRVTLSHRVGSRVDKHSFVMHRIKLAKKYWSISLNNLRKTLANEFRCCNYANEREIALVDIRDGFLWYLEGRFKCYELEEAEEEFARQSAGMEEFPHMVAMYLAYVLAMSKSPSTEFDSSDDISVLPVDVWLEVFSHLDTLTQNSLRGVCPDWASIMQSPLLTTNIVTGSRKLDAQELRDYNLTAPIFKCLRPSTRRLIQANPPAPFSDCGQMSSFLKMTDIVRYVQEATPRVHLSEVYLVHHACVVNFKCSDRMAQCTMQLAEAVLAAVRLGDREDSSLDEFIAACRCLPCDAVRLSRCRFILSLNLAPGVFKLAVQISAARLPVNDDLAGAVWGALEAGLPMPSEDQLRGLRTSLARITDVPDEDRKFRYYQRMACRLLHATQTADPRSSLHYLGKQWCVDGLQGLQVEKLSRIALHFLMQLAKDVDRL
ncbi:uncharacterized protein LOC129595780 [Paramacrobiotus metropolitanus]|uniref:uncharacterized protein LOC129595780 n=1 Tax=Paramacrobiotus metropolitanus TaxID=2943436 RepID=UPI0024456B9F|nr:uncharacterized protein LOC129595780 [Paramacrobiotus metropolitanus]